MESELGDELKYTLRYALPHVAYFFKTGPFHGAYVKYGVDPRTSPEYRFYQNELFRIAGGDERVKREPAPGQANGSSYEFDGTQLPAGGLLQLCDITEPTLARLIKEAKVRDELDFNDGWFDSQALYEVRRVIRLMISELRAGRQATQKQIDTILNDKRPPPPAYAQYQPPPSTSAARDADGDGAGDDSSVVTETQVVTEEQQIIDRLTEDTSSVPDKLKDLLGYVKQQDLPSQRHSANGTAMRQNGNDAMEQDNFGDGEDADVDMPDF
jgi:general transcription factor 3C polypeptide 5 (transcription factor C subunit 1)